MFLSDILAALPNLSADEISVVIATAKSLSSASTGKTSRRGKASNPKGSKSKKGPSQPVSKFEGNPDYQRFKTADKKLKEFLKQKKVSLKEAFADPGMLRAPEVAGFVQARGAWFLSKASLTSDPDHSKNGQEAATSSTA
jgi:hypothetical protein